MMACNEEKFLNHRLLYIFVIQKDEAVYLMVVINKKILLQIFKKSEDFNKIFPIVLVHKQMITKVTQVLINTINQKMLSKHITHVWQNYTLISITSLSSSRVFSGADSSLCFLLRSTTKGSPSILPARPFTSSDSTAHSNL